jgi:starvation-inducible outer membrane lipoprotein
LSRVGSCGDALYPLPTQSGKFAEEKRFMKRKRVVLSIFIALLALGLSACADRKKISEVTADPGRYADKEVIIVGRVTNSYGALNYGAFEIDDGTGKMWIVTEKYGVPSKGTQIGVKGRVIAGLTYQGRNYGTGLHETDRRTRETR